MNNDLLLMAGLWDMKMEQGLEQREVLGNNFALKQIAKIIALTPIVEKF